MCQGERLRGTIDANAAFSQLFGEKIGRGRMAVIPMNQCVNPATGAAGGDSQQASDGTLAEVRGEIGDDNEMIFLSDVPCIDVIIGNRLVLVAQVHLDHLFHGSMSTWKR